MNAQQQKVIAAAKKWRLNVVERNAGTFGRRLIDAVDELLNVEDAADMRGPLAADGHAYDASGWISGVLRHIRR